jgi:hypothetical protein
MRLRRTGYVIIGLLTLAMIVLSFVELWVINNTDSIQAYGAVQPNEAGLPNPNERAAFLVLSDNHSAQYPSNLLELLATTEAGVVDPTQGAHLQPNELKQVLVQTSVVGELTDYRVYRIGVETPDKMNVVRQEGGRAVTVEPANGKWEPGAWLVDVPAEGMFGGRTYYQFFVDPAK